MIERRLIADLLIQLKIEKENMAKRSTVKQVVASADNSLLISGNAKK